MNLTLITALIGIATTLPSFAQRTITPKPKKAPSISKKQGESQTPQQSATATPVLQEPVKPQFSPTKDETTAYILSEIQIARSYSQNSSQWFDTKDGVLFYCSRWQNSDENFFRENHFPIKNIDLYTGETRYGYFLKAVIRPGSTINILGYKNGVLTHTSNENTIIGESTNIEKIKKIEKAFNHLIEIESGRKELF